MVLSLPVQREVVSGMVRLSLIVFLLVGLAITVPVLCICNPADHRGLAVHSLLPHTHHPADGHAPAHTGVLGDPDTSLDQTVVQVSGASVQAGSGGLGFATVGAIDAESALAWRILLPPTGRLSTGRELPLPEHRWAPLSPPPRDDQTP